jgi:hypothetical protein
MDTGESAERVIATELWKREDRAQHRPERLIIGSKNITFASAAAGSSLAKPINISLKKKKEKLISENIFEISFTQQMKPNNKDMTFGQAWGSRAWACCWCSIVLRYDGHEHATVSWGFLGFFGLVRLFINSTDFCCASMLCLEAHPNIAAYISGFFYITDDEVILVVLDVQKWDTVRSSRKPADQSM